MARPAAQAPGLPPPMLAALRRRTFDEVCMVAVPCGLACFWWSEFQPSAEMRSAQRAAGCKYHPSADLIGPHVATELARRGIVELKGALTFQELAAARRDLAALVEIPGNFGATGNAADVRQDAVVWLQPRRPNYVGAGGHDRSFSGAGLEHCVRLLRGVAHALEEIDTDNTGRLHVVPLECQLSAFRGDKLAGYRAHRDTAPSGWPAVLELGLLGFLRSRDCRRRAVTAILYLNDSQWESGGELACFIGADASDTKGNTAQEVRRVVPRGGTLLLFDSTTLLHAVEPSRQDRYALTCWVWDDAK